MAATNAAVADLGQAMERNPLPPPHFLAFYAQPLRSVGRLAGAPQSGCKI
jgi:hypothetical protein